MSLVAIRPISITPGMLAGSTLLEDATPEWSASEVCAIGARRHLRESHRVYESLVDGNTNNHPLTTVGKWQDVLPTNRWAMFDLAVGPRSQAPSSFTVLLRPGTPVSAIALLDSYAARVRVVMRATPGGEVVVDREQSLLSVAIGDAYEYATAPFEYRTEFVLRGLPIYPNCELQVTVTGDGVSPAQLGELIVGTEYTFGDVLKRPRLEPIDYSSMEADNYGVTRLVERRFVRKLELGLLIPKARLNKVFATLMALRATPCVWVPTDDMQLDALIVYGVAREPRFDLETRTHYPCNLQIRGY